MYWDEGVEAKSIKKWFDKLTIQQFKSVAKEIEMLKLTGNELKMPHSKALGTGLFELRERHYGYRIYYTFAQGHVFILLAAGDKKSQENDIKVAGERLSKI